MLITQDLIFDLKIKKPQLPVDAVQNDCCTRAVKARLFDGSVSWDVPAGVTVAVAYKKPDGTCGLYDRLPDGSAAVTIDGSTITAIFAPQMMTVAGCISAALVLQDEKLDRLGTFPFTVRVAEDPAGGASVSNDYYKYTTWEDINGAVDALLTECTEAVETLTRESAPPIVCDASGSVVAVADAADRPLQGLTLYGKTTQNGTPTPEAPIELVSAGADGDIAVTVAGKNLFDSERLLQTDGICVYDEATGLWTTGLNGGYNRSVFSDVAGVGTDRDIKYLLPLSENTTYTIKLFDYATATTGVTLLRVNFHDKDGIHLGQKSFNDVATFTTPPGTRYVDFCRGHNVGNFSFSKIQLEVGSVATAYEAYKAQTITIPTENSLPGIPVSSGGNYTDENGQQWVTDEIDLARGVYVQRVGSVDLGTLKWTYETVANGFTCFCSPFNMMTPLSNAERAKYLLCSHYPATTKTDVTNLDNKSYASRQNGSFFIRNDDYSDVATFKDALNGVTLLYRLKTLIETPLTPEEIAAYSALHTNKLNTTVFNDSGAGQKIAYVADTKAYIDQKIAAISAAVLNA